MAGTVRAKFTVHQVNRHDRYTYEQQSDGSYTKTRGEIQDVKLSPVYSPDPESENRKFWDATPQGSIELGVINQEAWSAFELGKEYYVDFTPAEQEQQ